MLDSSEATQALTEEKLRKHSLRACFNLSLRRLSPKLLRQFAWLGILPEDVEITPQMAATLWAISLLQAKKVLQTLRNRAFLTLGTSVKSAMEGVEQTYRLHDLMHDTARWLIAQPQKGDLPGLGLSLPRAHQKLLDRYRKQVNNGQWHTLSDDGYIHGHLTWHMEQAECFDEIHELLQKVNTDGRNGWYEACDHLGQPAIFVTDLGRAWRLAEAMYAENKSRSVGLQVRYALIFATLNSLANNIPAELVAELVAQGKWSPAQGLAYAQQAQYPCQRSELIHALSRYLPPMLLKRALDVLACSILDMAHAPEDTCDFARALGGLLPQLPEDLLSEVLSIACTIDEEYNLTTGDTVLSVLAPYFSKDLLLKALDIAHTIKNRKHRAIAMIRLVPYLPKITAEALDVARTIENEYSRAAALSTLIPHLPENLLLEALDVAHTIQNQRCRAQALNILVPHFPEVAVEVLDTARTIENVYDRAQSLSSLVPDFPEIAEEALN